MMLFAIQIYCDFSGYTDIASGLARWMGFSFGPNFNHPYIALGFGDFWSRWHISLSTWFRDYVYIPLGGNRRSGIRVHGNLWLTMLLSGLWHGAAFTFIVWGACHALLLSIERLTQWPERLSSSFIGRVVGTLATFALILLTWVFFRAESFSQAINILGTMLGIHSGSSIQISGWTSVITKTMLLWASVLLAREIWIWIDLELTRRHQSRLIPRGSVRRIVAVTLEPIIVGLMLAASVFFSSGSQNFIYFQF